jgi:MFS family permease
MLMLGGARISNGAATYISVGSLVLASMVLIVAGAAPWLVFLFAALQGTGAGLFSILRPVLVAELLGKEGFGAISSAMSVGPVLANAAAPAIGAVLLHMGGADLTLLVCLALVVLALILTRAMLAPARGAALT